MGVSTGVMEALGGINAEGTGERHIAGTTGARPTRAALNPAWGLFDAGGLGHQDDGASIMLPATDCSPDLSDADIAAVRFLYP